MGARLDVVYTVHNVSYYFQNMVGEELFLSGVWSQFPAKTNKQNNLSNKNTLHMLHHAS